jgi:hypothetical protein
MAALRDWRYASARRGERLIEPSSHAPSASDTSESRLGRMPGSRSNAISNGSSRATSSRSTSSSSRRGIGSNNAARHDARSAGVASSEPASLCTTAEYTSVRPPHHTSASRESACVCTVTCTSASGMAASYRRFVRWRLTTANAKSARRFQNVRGSLRRSGSMRSTCGCWLGAAHIRPSGPHTMAAYLKAVRPHATKRVMSGRAALEERGAFGRARTEAAPNCGAHIARLARLALKDHCVARGPWAGK